MFIVRIITNLKNKKGRRSKQDFEVDGSLEFLWLSRNFKIKSFYCFLHSSLAFAALEKEKSSLEIKANTLALFINSVTITRKVKNEQLMNKVSLCSLLPPPHE